jgi:hypothetical protein
MPARKSKINFMQYHNIAYFFRAEQKSATTAAQSTVVAFSTNWFNSDKIVAAERRQTAYRKCV